ncbi:MAG: TIGR04282 family arsenosugar biosynthesis glycosyltransferase [Chloroflexota bacterium]
MTCATAVVYVIAKAPRPGTTKTRLCPPLTPDEAARLAGAFLLDTLDTVSLAGLTPRIVCRDADEREDLGRLVGSGVQISVQTGRGLGDALEGAFHEGFSDGFDAVAVLGADSPTIPLDILRQAFACLAGGQDVALGPTSDGGYYLLAARAVYATLFRDMTWGTDSVARETRRRCDALHLQLQELPTWYDVDEAASLEGLYRDLDRLPISIAPHTRAVLHAFPARGASEDAA